MSASTIPSTFRNPPPEVVAIITAAAEARQRDPNAPGAGLAGLHLNNVSFARMNLGGADLRGASLHGCSFRGANLEEANFSGSSLESCTFHRALMGKVILNNTSLASSALVEADLTAARLHNANLNQTTFENAILSWSQLQGAHGFDTIFRHVRMDNANLSKVQFSSPNLDNLIAPSSTWTEAHLQKIDASTCDFSDSVWSKACLIEVVLRGRPLFTRADMAGAVLRSCEFENPWMINVNLTGGRLIGVEMQDPNGVNICLNDTIVERLKIYGGLLEGSNWRKANVREIYMLGGSISGSDLTDATFTLGKLVQVSQSNVRMMGATLMVEGLDDAPPPAPAEPVIPEAQISENVDRYLAEVDRRNRITDDFIPLP